MPAPLTDDTPSETIALQPRAPFYAQPEQFVSYERFVEKAAAAPDLIAALHDIVKSTN
jgi:hypothetical protein